MTDSARQLRSIEIEIRKRSVSMSQSIFFNLGRSINRRTLLRGAGVSMALPWLTAMERACASTPAPKQPKRFVAMTLGLGLIGDNLNPQQSGSNYELSPYLQEVAGLKDRFTVVSGTSHPEVAGGHRAEASILTANPAGASGKARNTISLDQYMAKYLGTETRYPSLVLSSSGSDSPSYTESGAMIPAEDSPSKLFRQLFINDSATDRKQQAERAIQGQSIMDLVAEDTKRLSRKLGAGDKQRLDSYLTSVRDLENRLAESEAWANRPKPQVDMPIPKDIGDRNDFIGRQRLMNDMIRLAFQTDSTRFVTYHLGGSGGVVPLPGVTEGYHGLSHHGLDEEKLDQLAIVEKGIISAWGQFLSELNGIEEQGRPLLDQTTVFLTSNLGNSSNHSSKNMPVLLAGGDFKHGQHLAFDQKNNYPLPNLYVSILQQLGMPVGEFFSSTGTMKDLDWKQSII